MGLHRRFEEGNADTSAERDLPRQERSGSMGCAVVDVAVGGDVGVGEAVELENVLRHQSPYFDVREAEFVDGGAGVQELEFDDAGALDDVAAETLDELDGGGERASGGDQVVNDEDAVARLDGAARDAENVGAGVLLGVCVAVDGVGHLSLLAEHDERLLQGERDRRSEDEPARVEAADAGQILIFVAIHQDFDHQSERLGIRQEPADVVEPRDLLVRKVGSDARVAAAMRGLWVLVLVRGGLSLSVIPRAAPRREARPAEWYLARRRQRVVMASYSVGVVGATGAVGRELLGVLEKREFPVSGSPLLFGSSGGKTVATEKWGVLEVDAFEMEKVRGLDVVFLAASGDFAKAHADEMASVVKGCVVDNSSALRLRRDVPLVVPEVNGEQCKGAKLIANPNCTTAIAIMALYPLFAAFGLKKVIVSTYQAASGAGAAGMKELRDGVAGMGLEHVAEDGCFTDKKLPNEVFAHPLAFNVIPHIDKFQDNAYTKEEMKVTWETKKILGFDFDSPDEPLVSCTAVRIPTLRAHAEAITVETDKPCTPEAARDALRAAPGLRLADDPAANLYPMPISATGDFDVEVGRVRQNLVFGDKGLDFFVCGDQLLRGAALNAVLIAEKALF
eukprot:CAMPEP_0197392360 /NCGR_PEP_ID=MMETSP1165-20131217/3675_1 /TAXON_ID=284809 /ORGANISM="Chrysocystis fragilis, Strain CCMP3189" /LENGTH=620 /DNA_ID=CAMNT_0042917983 /DNA_START=17 /DNA_END=1878 /DNA_ORIENTATION=-